ncbi:AB hydrolase-1 domain-containing protein [Favolaschia claudopus]|uniref:AB hydrolase-1 domain-containing protein n=1 Tax=Favolaschia claudopus TaxID=2862362 RepID=A0AAW0CJN8_9AGAR
MPTVHIPGKNLQFFFTDSGAPPDKLADYTTFILVHGHTYHGAVFQKLLPLAASQTMRLICINRREYPGSTSHTADELAVYASGMEEERAVLMHQAGVNLALAIDGIIQQCDLPSAGDVAIAGWSLGNTFVLAAVEAIMDLPPPVRERLQSFVKTVIMWDPPCQALGIANPPKAYVPLYDEDLPPAARGPAFAKWVASYFVHGDLSTHDPNQLNYRDPDLLRKATFEDTPLDEVLSIIDFTVGDKCDTIVTLSPFASVVASLVENALFAPGIRAAWKNTKMVHMYGLANSWNVLYAVWDLERRVEAAQGKAPITFRPIEGANHFIMWEDPSLTLKELLKCAKL